MMTEAGSPRRPLLKQGATSAACCCSPHLKAKVGRFVIIMCSTSADAGEGQKQASGEGAAAADECIDMRLACVGGPCVSAARAGWCHGRLGR